MSMIQLRALFFFGLSFFSLQSFADQGHRFIEFDQHVFLTRQERQDFFTQLGATYLNDIVFVAEVCKGYDFTQLQGYQEHQEYYDRLTELYSGHIANQTLAPMSIRWISPQIGYGVFAEGVVRKGDFIGIYGGIVIEQLRMKNTDYAWNFPIPNNTIMLDAAIYGNEISLVNDGQDPNCVMAQILDRNGACYICYIADRDIAIGEQFLVSYGTGYWKSRKYAYQEMGQAGIGVES